MHTGEIMILELGVGDAYGVGFEFVSSSIVDEHNTAEYYIKHPRHPIAPGFYSDDTQMTLAIAEAILAEDKWTKYNLASRFVDVFHRDPRTGYAGRFYKFLKKTKTAKEFLDNINPKSDKSGAAMRTAPLGLFPDVEEIIEKTEIQASVTHDTEDGKEAAVAASLLVYFFNNDLGPIEDAGKWLTSMIGGDWDEPWEGKVKAKGWMSVRAAITAVSRNTNYTELLKDCVAFTGDVDTVAAIAMAAASVSSQYTRELPLVLFHCLENREYGRDYLINLDKQLFDYFK